MTTWKCGHCGFILNAEAPPQECPNCKKQCEFLNNTCYTPDCAKESIDRRIK